MREILFKAKRLNDGEWVEGNIVYVAEDADFMPGAYILPRLVSASAARPQKVSCSAISLRLTPPRSASTPA